MTPYSGSSSDPDGGPPDLAGLNPNSHFKVKLVRTSASFLKPQARSNLALLVETAAKNKDRKILPFLFRILAKYPPVDPAAKYPQKKKAGLIGTTGTVKSRIYNQSKNMTTEVIYPTDQLQEETMRAIYQTKAGRNSEAKETVIKVATHLIENGVEIIICGCTEISLLLNREDISVPLVDPLQILAEVTVEYAKGKK